MFFLVSMMLMEVVHLIIRSFHLLFLEDQLLHKVVVEQTEESNLLKNWRAYLETSLLVGEPKVSSDSNVNSKLWTTMDQSLLTSMSSQRL